MDGVATHTSQALVGRDAELAELASLLGVRPVPGQPTPSGPCCSPATPASARPGCSPSCATSPFTEGWQVVAGHCLDFGDSALPYLPFSEVLGRLAADLPDVVDTVAAAHPSLARLQPGRRVLGAPRRLHRHRGLRPRPRRPVRGRARPARGRRRPRRPLLLVIEDAHWADQSTRDMLSFLFSRPFDGPVGRGRVVPLRRPAPPPPAAPPGRPSGPASAASSGCSSTPLPAADVRALIAELARRRRSTSAEIADIVDRAEGNAFFVEELVGAASGPGRWVPDDLADVLLVRLDRLDDDGPPGGPGRERRRPQGLPRAAGRRLRPRPPTALDEGLRQAVEMQRPGRRRGPTYSFRHALLGEAVYDDLLPGERVRLHAAYAEALRSGRGPGHRRRAGPARPAGHGPARPRSTASDPRRRRGQRGRRPGRGRAALPAGARAARRPAPRRASADGDLSKLVAKAADALIASGHPIRAAALVGEQLDRLPADAPPAYRSPGCSRARATALVVMETDEDPAGDLPAGRRPGARGRASGLRAKVLAVHARILSSCGRFEEAQAAGLEALALAERLDLPSWPPRRSPR